MRLNAKAIETMTPLVSIHAPREGCDVLYILLTRTLICFNSRTPGGVRHRSRFFDRQGGGFNSRTPGGVRLNSFYSCHLCDCFNSRTPGGVRLLSSEVSQAEKEFQFTHPGRGATCHRIYVGKHHRCFNSRTPGGVRRRHVDVPSSPQQCFNSRTPGGVRPSLRFFIIHLI